MTTELGVDKVELKHDGVSIQWTDGHSSFYGREVPAD